MGVKILITGAFSTGKTETVSDIIEALHKEGNRVVLLPDLARSCPLPLNEGQTHEASIWLAMNQVSREIEASLCAGAVVICDRGVPDIIAHVDDIFDDNPTESFIGLRRFLLHWCETYDLIMSSEIDEGMPVVIDGLRSSSSAYRTRLGDRSRAVLAQIGASSMLPFGRSERLSYALAAIRPLLMPPDRR